MLEVSEITDPKIFESPMFQKTNQLQSFKLDNISNAQYEFLKECWIIEDEDKVREFKTGIPAIIVYNTDNRTLKIEGYFTKRTNERILNSMKSLIDKKTMP